MMLEHATGGHVFFNYDNEFRDITAFNKKEMFDFRRKVQMVFQDPYSALNPQKKIYTSFEEPLKVHGMSLQEEREARMRQVLSMVNIQPDYLMRYPHEFSGGQRQRIIIARCLVVTPKIIFADEPISALDVSLQAQVINMLMDLQDKYKLSMLLIAHDLAVVRQIADQIKIMYFGEIVESAPSSEIYKNAQHTETEGLLKAAPRIGKGLEDAGFDIDLKPGDIPDPAKPMPGCPFCTRCIYADERCMKERPEETEVSPGHTVRCHKAGQI